MTTLAFNRATCREDLTAAEKLSKSAFLVYRALSRMAAAHGNGFRAKHETIATQAGCSISTVQRALRELIACQMVRTRANARTIAGRNYRISNSYYLLRAAAWCFSDTLKRLAKIIRKAIRLPDLKPVSVKPDRASRIERFLLANGVGEPVDNRAEDARLMRLFRNR